MRINGNNCIGCGSCSLICHKNAISIVEDDYGFYVANVDENKCVDCGLCLSVCPLVTIKKNPLPEQCFAAWDLDNKSRIKSTSGGIATLAARNIILNGGIAYLCSSRIKNERIGHVRVDNLTVLEECRGSKYVQSFTGKTFEQCKKDLMDGKEVLYIGTPCQISGLKNYLKKEYDNLILVDLICHGVPSNLFLKEHLKGLYKNSFFVSFRDNSGYNLRVISENEEVLFKKNECKDLYYIAFNSSVSFNSECLKCKYSTPERVGDLTLGDFWGLGKDTPFLQKNEYGCSVVVPNNEKGLMFLKRIEKHVFFEKREYKEAVKGNHNLSMSSSCKYDFNVFRKRFLKKGFDKAVKKTCKRDIFKGFMLRILNGSAFGRKIISIIR